jgi:hypothetical protein
MAFNCFGSLLADDTDPILEFYKKRADEVYKSRNPFNAGVNYSFIAKTYYYVIEDDGFLKCIDSSIIKYFYSFGDQDSTIEVVSSNNKQDQPEFNYQNIFINDYLFNFFPNDTGGENISIGFDSKVFSYEQPVGFVILNRNLFFMKMLHLYYNHERRDKRISKSFRFIEHEGFVFPDSLWEIKAKRGILSVDYYRTETGITDIHIYR